MMPILIRIFFSLIIFSPFLYTQTSLDSGLVLYYPFNGNAQDRSGNGNHGVVTGMKWVKDRFGNPQSAAGFERTDDFITVPFSSDFDFSETKQLSVGFWADNLRIRVSKPTSNFGFGFNASLPQSEITASFYWIRIYYHGEFTNKWYHCLFTADDKFITLWVDGSLIGQRSVYNVKWEKITMQDIDISTGGVPKKGAIDEIRIYNRVLSDKEIQQLYKYQK